VTPDERYRLFESWKAFLQFDEGDAARLRAMAPLVEQHGPSITDRFYARLAAEPDTARFLEGRLEQLKNTHAAYLRALVAGDYGRDYLESRWRVGMAHVRIGLAPAWVEATMSAIRAMMTEAMVASGFEGERLVAGVCSLLKICDLDLMVINLSYAEDRLERFSHVTGMRRTLIENLIKTRRAAAYLGKREKG